MNHPAEIKIHRYLEDVRKAKRGMNSATIARIVKDVQEAVEKQFNQSERKFTMRMSNIGRPYCQLWFDKNQPEEGIDMPANFLMNMMIGDIVEAVFKGVLTEAGVEFSDGFKSTLTVGKHKIDGTHDLIMDKRVDDIKSASPWSYNNKFESLEKLQKGDSFGYIPQLVGYAEAAGKGVGGWWAINKANGEFKYVDASSVDKDKVLEEIQQLVDYIDNDEPFKRCFDPVPETYYKKPSGNMVLSKECGFCSFKHKCYPDMKVLPSKVSKSDNPKMVEYTYLKEY